jgi:hypothetical protein
MHGRGGGGDPFRSRQATGSPAPTLGVSSGRYAPPSYDMNLISAGDGYLIGPAPPPATIGYTRPIPLPLTVQAFIGWLTNADAVSSGG